MFYLVTISVAATPSAGRTPTRGS